MSATSLANGFQKIIKLAGQPINIFYYNSTIGSVWDDGITLSISGSVSTSGVVLPIDQTRGSTDSVLQQQGNLIGDEQKLYVNGSLQITGSNQIVKIQLGGDKYTLVPNGAIVASYSNTDIYKKVYIRYLPGGSLIGE